MDLQSIAQVAYDQIYGNNTAQNAIKVEHFIEVAKSRYAYEMWLQSKTLGRAEGEWEIPSAILRDGEIEVKDNEADISALNIFRSLKGEVWLASIGAGCDCDYMRVTPNMYKILCGTEYTGNSKPYIVTGNKIKFPEGTHHKELPITYASNGLDISERKIEVDDAIGALVSDYLWKRFTNRLPVDRTNDANENK